MKRAEGVSVSGLVPKTNARERTESRRTEAIRAILKRLNNCKIADFFLKDSGDSKPKLIIKRKMELPPDKRKLVIKQLHKLLAQNELDLYYKDAETELFSLMSTCTSGEALKNALIDSDEFLYQHPSRNQSYFGENRWGFGVQSANS
jgi:hypothetical protein